MTESSRTVDSTNVVLGAYVMCELDMFCLGSTQREHTIARQMQHRLICLINLLVCLMMAQINLLRGFLFILIVKTQ